MFINFTNHPVEKWSSKELEEAQKWGEIKEYPFPQVNAYATEEEIEQQAQEIVEELMELKPDAVMCQGEFTLTYAIVTKLKKLNIEVLSACSDRITEEHTLEDGTTEKKARFEFIKFRRY